MTTAERLARWAHDLVPGQDDLPLAGRSLRDTLAGALAAPGHPVVRIGRELGRVGAWAVAAHVLDFDDLHTASTTHISAVIVPAAVATEGGARAYLAGAGAMARLGTMLGWAHYRSGWHATCTAGAPAAAVAAAVGLGLDETRTAHALALAIPAAGGVQRAFGSDAKSLQIGMAAGAGVRAAILASRGARADLTALEQWLELIGAESPTLDAAGPAVPGGLAVKLYPCCYAMQRPIHAVRRALGDSEPSLVESITVRTPAAAVVPLVHHRPRTGLEGKFSLEYAVATTVLDGFPTLASFTDAAVRRPEAEALVDAVSVELEPGGRGLLDGTCDVVLRLRDGSARTASVDHPPGSPGYPPTAQDLAAKFAGCGPHAEAALLRLEWSNAAEALDTATGGSSCSDGPEKPGGGYASSAHNITGGDPCSRS